MFARLGLRRVLVVLVAVGSLAVGATAAAGPWSSLPEAVAALDDDGTDRQAEGVLRAAEDSVLAEARAGRLAATAALMDAYESLVTPLPDGEARSASLRTRAASVLLAFGDRLIASDPEGAGSAWAFAAELDPMPAVLVRLEDLLLPPTDPEPGQVWRSTVDGAELVFVPGAEFELGCIPRDRDCRADEDGGPVTVEEFWIERTEVTAARYRLCVEAGACSPPAESPAWDDRRRGDQPVTGVTWKQARQYATWVGRLLPSEAVWQRAARDDEVGGRYPWGRGRDRTAANLYQTAEGDPFEELAPVASFPATGYGLYDMGGNVWEWCADRYHRGLVGAPRDGRPWVRGGWGRTLRGGSWRRTMDLARTASRTWHEEDYFADDVGFRCVAEPRDRVSPQRLVELARRVYPWRSAPGTELDGSALSPSDREYLELRSLTWLVLEGRIAEALPLAVSMLKRNRSNRVALELLEQIEREMEVGIRRGDVTMVRAAVSGYRSAVAGDRRLASRLSRHERELATQSRASVEAFVGRGEYDLAGVTLKLALELAPGDPSLTASLTLAEPSPGSRRFSARDGKLMVWVPSGAFRMGASPGDGAADYDEHPAREVTVEGFWMDAHEVTNAEYRRCVEDGGCTAPTRSLAFEDPAMDEHPVLFITWFQAANYAKWAGKRLPSEAEWERAARGGTGSRFPWGGEFQQMRANGMESLSDDPYLETGPVGSFEPGPWGLYDMLGNAAEWVADIYQRTYWGAPRDQRPWFQITGEWIERERVIRGGSFLSGPNKLRVSSRNHKPPHETARDIGFRCAADR
jgi:formylglycine-generating enzyme required for sulfatase activity